MRTRLVTTLLCLALLAGCGGSSDHGNLTDAERRSRGDARDLAAAISPHGHLLEMGRHSPYLAYCYDIADGSHPIGVTATYVYSLGGATRTERDRALSAARRTYAHRGWKVGTASDESVDATKGERSALVHAWPHGSVSITTMTPCIRSEHPKQLKERSAD